MFWHERLAPLLAVKIWLITAIGATSTSRTELIALWSGVVT